jgi:hypothetical protein
MIRMFRSLNEIASIRTWAMFLSGPPLLAFSAWLVWIVAFAGWPSAQASRQLDILGKGLWISLCLLGVVVVALAAAKVRAQGFGGTALDIQSGDNDGRQAPREPPAVVTTTTTEVKP